MTASWLDEIPVRRLVEEGVVERVALAPGDRPLVTLGQTIAAGEPLLDRLRDARVEEVEVRPAEGGPMVPGNPYTASAPHRGRAAATLEGELLAPVAGRARRWRLATGEHHVPVAAVASGTVAAIVAGSEIRIALAGRAVRGAFAAGHSARGRLELATDASGELRAGGIDVGRTGTILVVGSRIDAEALTRARAMGVAGIVVASLAGKDLRDFQASERRQQAALHPSVPFAVLVLDGANRRPLATPLADLLARLAGADAAILVDPPALVFDVPGLDVPTVAPDWVRARGGPNAGAEGRVLELPGIWRFPGGVHLESARVAFGDAEPVIVPLADLERLG